MKVVIKSKPTDVETCNMINKMALGCGFTLASIYERNKAETGFRYNDYNYERKLFNRSNIRVHNHT